MALQSEIRCETRQSRVECTVETFASEEKPIGYDVREFIVDGGTFEQLLAVAKPFDPNEDTAEDDSTAVAFVPFPVDELPEPFGTFVKRGAEAIGCDEASIALPLLSAAAAVVGNSRRIRLKNGWSEPCVLWSVVIAESGTKKSPAFDLALRALNRMQSSAFREYRILAEEYEIERHKYESELQDWKRKGRKNGDQQPQPPKEPVAERYVCQDTTVEALAVLLEQQPRGLLMARDELSGWMNSFDAYKAARGADVAHWLALHRAAPLSVDRKSGRRLIYVPRAAVSIAGCIQPGTLAMALGGRSDSADGHEHFENGLAARLLLAMPPRHSAFWTEIEVQPDLMAAVASVFKWLLSLDFTIDENGEPVPVDLPLTSAGKRRWISFYNEHAVEQV